MSNPSTARNLPSSGDLGFAEMEGKKFQPLRQPPRIVERQSPSSTPATVQRRPEARRAPEPKTFGLHAKFEQDLQSVQRAPAPDKAAAHLHQARYYAPASHRSSVSAAAPSFSMATFAQPVWIVGIAMLVGLFVLWNWFSAPSRTNFISGWPGAEQGTIADAAQAQPQPQLATPAGQHSLVGAPSLTAEQINAVLTKFGSPAVGTGAAWVALGRQYNIDPAYALAFFIHESSAGTNPNWAGLKGGGGTTHNVGNIICAGYATCFGRFRDYPDWQTGIADWYRLIRDEYVQGRNVHTLEQIIPIYAPSSENNVPAYVQAVETLINSWKN